MARFPADPPRLAAPARRGAESGQYPQGHRAALFPAQLGIPDEWARRVHQNRLLQTAREGANTDVAHLREFGEERRRATLVAVVLDTMATLTDVAREMHERAIGREFKKAERRHLDAFQQSGKAINEKVRLYAAVGKALIDAKIKAADPFAEIEKLMTWEAFLISVEEAAKLSLPEDFDYLALVGNGYSFIRRYASEFLAAESILRELWRATQPLITDSQGAPYLAVTITPASRWEAQSESDQPTARVATILIVAGSYG